MIQSVALSSGLESWLVYQCPFMLICCGMIRVIIWRTEVLILGRFRVTWGITIFNIQCVIPNLLLPSFKGCGMVHCSVVNFVVYLPRKKSLSSQLPPAGDKILERSDIINSWIQQWKQRIACLTYRYDRAVWFNLPTQYSFYLNSSHLLCDLTQAVNIYTIDFSSFNWIGGIIGWYYLARQWLSSMIYLQIIVIIDRQLISLLYATTRTLKKRRGIIEKLFLLEEYGCR